VTLTLGQAYDILTALSAALHLPCTPPSGVRRRGSPGSS
jgi:hypothetical protein